MPCGVPQGGEQVAERGGELLGEGVPHDGAVAVEGGLPGEEDQPGAGGGDGVGEAGGRGEFGGVVPVQAHGVGSSWLVSRARRWDAYSSLAMIVRWTSVAPS